MKTTWLHVPAEVLPGGDWCCGGGLDRARLLGVVRSRPSRPADFQLGVALHQHFRTLDHANCEQVVIAGLEFSEALALEMKAFVRAIQGDAELVGTGG
jgi:hypothetical protein